MPFNLILSRALAKAGWKVKIRDQERLEEPHVTVIRGTGAWRIGLRNRGFLDAGKWKEFPHALRRAIEENWEVLSKEWDALYPNNPVGSAGEDANDKDG